MPISAFSSLTRSRVALAARCKSRWEARPLLASERYACWVRAISRCISCSERMHRRERAPAACRCSLSTVRTTRICSAPVFLICCSVF
nr:hypothetical protein [Snodgrassella alvi]